MTMKPEIKKAWTDELDSGRHVQGRGLLLGVQLNEHETPMPEAEPTKCCLMVLTHVAIEAGAVPNLRVRPAKVLEGERYPGDDPEYIPPGIEMRVQDDREPSGERWIDYPGETLPPEVAYWAGLSEQDPLIQVQIEGRPKVDALLATNLNDSECWSFAQIAAAIRADDKL